MHGVHTCMIALDRRTSMPPLKILIWMKFKPHHVFPGVPTAHYEPNRCDIVHMCPAGWGNRIAPLTVICPRQIANTSTTVGALSGTVLRTYPYTPQIRQGTG